MAAKKAPDTTNTEKDLQTFEEGMIYYEVSFSDVIKHTAYKRWADKSWDGRDFEEYEGDHTANNEFLSICYPAPPSEVLDRILWELGLDTSQNYEPQDLVHRNFASAKVKCMRWVGYRRTDQVWLDFVKRLQKGSY